MDNSAPDITTGNSQTRKITRKTWKNVLVLGVGWLLHYIGLAPIRAVQSSLNSTQGLGTVALSVNYTFGIVTSMFLAVGLIRKLETKWIIVFGSFTNAAYIAANFYPTWGTLLPTAGLSGIGTFLMWTSVMTYLNKMSKWYALQIGADVVNVSPRFFGTFYAMYYGSNILGNAASSFILGFNFLSIDDHYNQTMPYDVQRTCGAQYCNEVLGTSFNWKALDSIGNVTAEALGRRTQSGPPEVHRIYTLCGFCLISVLLSSVVFVLFLDNLKKLNVAETAVRNENSALKAVVASFMNFKNPKQWLLLPLALYNGMDNYFLYADFTKAFITCPLGVQYIGVMTACSNTCSLAGSFISGWFNTKRTRWMPFAITGLTQLIPAFILLNWIPSEKETTVQYILSASWGLGGGLLNAQIGAYYGIVFADNIEPAMANSNLGYSSTSMIFYAISHLLCIYIKLYLIVIVLVITLIGVALVEIWMRTEDRKLQKSRAKESVALAPVMK